MTDPFARAEVSGARAMLDVLIDQGLISVDHVNQAVTGRTSIPQEMLDRAISRRLPSWGNR